MDRRVWDRVALRLSCAAGALSFALAGFAAAGSAATPDEIYVVSTRRLGAVCDAAQLNARLQCEKLTTSSDGGRNWRAVNWHSTTAASKPTLVYVHGNRVDRGEDRMRGLAVYQTLAMRAAGRGPVRMIIWSWPSEQIRGPVRDYKVKAARTRPAGWQLAWYLNQLPAQAPATVMGYSYGARVATAALHILGGGDLGGLRLPAAQRQPQRRFDVALIAAAVDASWIRPGGPNGRALARVNNLLLINNRLDPAMRFYHITFGRKAQALGYQGLLAGRPGGRLWSLDATEPVGRSHALTNYLAKCPELVRVWPD